MLQALTSESNGEISCSVEETNRIRKELGLRPLDLETKSDDHVVVTKKPQDSNEALRRRLEKSKRKREEKKKEKEFFGKDTIVTQTLKSESVEDWVKRSRTIKHKVEKKSKTTTEYGSSDLKGLALAHSLNHFKEGETILTLRDADVLDEDGEDMLENINMADYDRDEERLKRKEKASRPVYTGNEDDEDVSMRKETNVKNRILRHYDEEEKLEERRRKAKARLDGRQFLSASSLKEAEEARKRMEALKGLRNGETVTSLDDIKYSEVSDYYTNEEMSSFSKKKRKKKKKKKKKKSKQFTTKSLIEELEDDIVDDDGDNELKNKSSSSELPSDRTIRKRMEKQRSYALALDRAREQSAAVSRQEEGVVVTNLDMLSTLFTLFLS